MKKLTSAQVEKLSIALAYQFKGKVISIGNFTSPWADEVEVGQNKFVVERQKVSFFSEEKIGNKIFGKVLKNSGCLQYLNLGYDRYHLTYMVNVEKVLEYSNGQDVIDIALSRLTNSIRVKNQELNSINQ
jgi:hypothetical protein